MRFLIFCFVFFLSYPVSAINFGFNSEPEFLPVDQAFQMTFSAPDTTHPRLLIEWKIEPGYYLYQHQLSFSAAEYQNMRLPSLPEGEKKEDPYFGQVVVYRDNLQLSIPLPNSAVAGQTVHAILGYQGCADKGLCYPPQKTELQFDIPPQVQTVTTQPVAEFASSAGSVIATLSNESWGVAALTLFGLGLLLSFTPCVLPMIPIVSAIVVGSRQHPVRAFYYSALYVLSMAFTYAALGALVGYFGTQLNIQAQLQNPILLSISAILFVLLALAMFDVYELKLPAALQRRLEGTGQEHSNKFIAVITAGILATLIVSPCVSAPLAGVVLYISTQGDAAYGAGMLFIMALGMGVPLLLVGLFGPSILPKSGHWLNDIKVTMGFGLIAVAIWLITRWTPSEIYLYLWGTLFISIGSYFLHRVISGHSHPIRLAIAIVFILFGAAQWIGGTAGGKRIDQPLSGLSLSTANNTKEASLEFITIGSLSELNQLKTNADPGRAIMLDFYADWCISCKVIEEEIFHVPEVAALLKKITLVRVDVTENNSDNQAFLKHYNLFGPPAILFIDRNRQDLDQFALIGEPTKSEVLDRLRKLTSSSSKEI